MDLEEAISSSVTEGSLEKIKCYCEQLSYGANILDSKTVSVLLSSFEKSVNDAEKVFNVSCVIIYLNNVLQHVLNSSLLQLLSENICKICEACFCISVKLADKALIGQNISLLETIIKFNQDLTNNICGYLLDPLLTALLVYNISDYDLLLRLAKLTSSLCQTASRMKMNEIMPTVTSSINRLPNLVISCGDYEIQAAILEIIVRCNYSFVPSLVLKESNQMLNLFSCSEKLREEFIKHSFVNFEPDCRLFLNALNESLGDERQVYSIPCKCIVFNNFILNKPRHPNYKSFWLDFNLGRNIISCHEPSDNYLATHLNYLSFISFDEVIKVISKNTICLSKPLNKTVEYVKTEFSINFKNDALLRVELLKIYSRKIFFKQLHRVLVSLFADIYECEADFDPKSGIDSFLNPPIREICSPPFKGYPVSNEPHKFSYPQKLPSKSGTHFFTPSEIDLNRNPSNFTVSSDKLSKNSSDTVCPSYSNNQQGKVSNFQLSHRVGDDTRKNTSSFVKNQCNIKQMNKVRKELGNFSAEVNDNISYPKVKKSAVDRTSCESVMNDYLKKPADNCHITKGSGVKRKKLYSIENGNTSEKSNICHKKVESKKKPFRLLSSDESDESIDSVSLNQVTSSNLSHKGKYDKIPENALPSTQFSHDIFQNHSLPVNSKKNNPKTCSAYSNKKKTRARFSILPLSSPGTSDSDYKPISYKETIFNVENKNMLRKRRKQANTRDSIEKTKANPSKVVTVENGYGKEKDSKIPTPPKMPKMSESCFKTKEFQTKKSNGLHNIHSYKTKNKDIYLLTKEPKKGGSGFIKPIDFCKKIESIQCDIKISDNDIDDKAVQPETYDFLPREITLEPECQIQGQTFDPADVGMCVGSNTADDMISRGKSNIKSISLEKGNPLNMWNEEEISVQIHSDSLVRGDDSETSFKVDDILELCQKNELNLQNNFEANLIQSQKERQQHLNNDYLLLQTSRNYILENCEKLQSSIRELDNLIVKFSKTSNKQHDLVNKIQSEIAILEKAKEELFKKESKVNNSESSIIIKLFKGVGNYIMRLMFTTSNQNQTDRM